MLSEVHKFENATASCCNVHRENGEFQKLWRMAAMTLAQVCAQDMKKKNDALSVKFVNLSSVTDHHTVQCTCTAPE